MKLNSLAKLDETLVLMESNVNSKLLTIFKSCAIELNVPIYIIGGMALSAYNYNRYTNDIDILVDKSSIDQLVQWLGSKWSLMPIGSNKLSNGSIIVNICYPGLKAGEFIFPDLPDNKPGLHVVSLQRLMAMKIEANRYRDRADFVELIKINKLSIEFINNEVVPLIGTKMGKRMAVALWNRAASESGCSGKANK